MRVLLIAGLAALTVTPALADGQVAWSNGATAEWTRDCTRSEGTAVCTVDGLFTGSQGKTASKTRVRTTQPGSSTTVITVTGPNGDSRTRTRNATWGN